MCVEEPFLQIQSHIQPYFMQITDRYTQELKHIYWLHCKGITIEKYTASSNMKWKCCNRFIHILWYISIIKVCICLVCYFLGGLSNQVSLTGVGLHGMHKT